LIEKSKETKLLDVLNIGFAYENPTERFSLLTAVFDLERRTVSYLSNRSLFYELIGI
jgi:hypothetical protein